MRKIALFIGFFLLLAPSLASAQTITPSCSAKGYTVIFVNGVFDSRKDADNDKDQLAFKLGSTYNGEPVNVQLGYNPSHLAGAGDLLQSTAQLFSSSISDFDLDTILMEMYPEITTRKLVIVGHSQGALYANGMYSYLLAHGEPKDAVNIYNVASPAPYTAGNGTYLNSSGDALLGFLRNMGMPVLPSNIDLYASDTTAIFPGHDFVTSYLGQAGGRMQSDIDGEMSMLAADDASNTSDCFTPPSESVGYKAEAAAFAVADPTAVAIKTGTIATVQASEIAVSALSKVAVGAVQMFAGTIEVTSSLPTEQKQTQVGEKIIDKLYGSSVDSLSPQDQKDLLGSNQASAIVLSNPPKEQTVSGIVLGTSTDAASVAPVATTTVATATSTPAVATTTAPVIDPNFFNWLPGGGSGGLPIVATADNEATNTSDIADTTPPTTDGQTPPPAPAAAVLLDNFDAYDGSGWSTIQNNPNGTYVNFAFDDGAAGDCRSGGCLSAGNSGVGGLGGGGHVDYMYKDTGTGGLNGAYSIWGFAQKGWFGAQGTIGLCLNAASGCGDSSSTIQFANVVANDAQWHQYYFAWRQGTDAVEDCFLVDDTNSADCSWSASSFPLGAEFEAIMLTGFNSRHDLGDSLYFDNLESEPLQN